MGAATKLRNCGWNAVGRRTVPWGRRNIFANILQPLANCCIPPYMSFAQDVFVKRCKRFVESISENDLWVDGAYMSEKDMANEGIDASFGGN